MTATILRLDRYRLPEGMRLVCGPAKDGGGYINVADDAQVEIADTDLIEMVGSILHIAPEFMFCGASIAIPAVSAYQRVNAALTQVMFERSPTPVKYRRCLETLRQAALKAVQEERSGSKYGEFGLEVCGAA
jgi:hypothetical protein